MLKEKDLKVGKIVATAALKKHFDQYALHVLEYRLADVETKRRERHKVKIIGPLPTVEDYRVMRDAKYATSIEQIVSEAYGEFQGLRDEMDEWHGNLPESFQNGDKGAALEQARDELAEFCDDEPDVPDAIKDKKFVFLPNLDTGSRPKRLYEAKRQLEKVCAWIEDRFPTDHENLKDAGLCEDCLDKIQAVTDVYEECQKAIEACDNVEFPGMY